MNLGESTPESLDCSEVEVRFGATAAVRRATLHVNPGEIVALLGRSGSGKTTLLRAIAGFEPVTAGTIRIGDRTVESQHGRVPAHHRSVGLVFQEYALFPHKTVAGNVAYGLQRGSEARVRELLDMGRLAGLERRYPHQLSGGQQQRVALLRSLAPRPRILLLDEPFSNLDAGLRVAMRTEVASILRAEGTTALLVTHDRGDAMAAADRIGVMEAGEVITIATPHTLYYCPESRVAAEYGGEVQFLPANADGLTASSPLGPVTLTAPVRGPCDVLVRPEWVVPTNDGVRAEIESRGFEGANSRLILRLPGGASVTMTTPSVLAGRLTAGSRFGVAGSVPAFPRQPFPGISPSGDDEAGSETGRY